MAAENHRDAWAGVMFIAVGASFAIAALEYRFLFPAIAVFCCIGGYSVNNNTFDACMVAMFAFVGYLFLKLRCEPAPLLLGFILGPMMEGYLRRALLLSRGEWGTFVERPLSLGLLITASGLIVLVTLPAVRKKREVAFQEA